MSVLTIEETKKRYKEMWLWLAEETRRRKRVVEKEEFFLEHKEYDTPLFNCWCCEFAKDTQNAISHLRLLLRLLDCDFCPIKDWQTKDLAKSCTKGLYGKWLRALKKDDWQKAADLAERIANLPFKKAFDITPEQAKLLRDKGYGEIYSTEEMSNGD